MGANFFGKGPREQYKGIQDVGNDQGFAEHYRAISNTASYLEVFRCERINTAKQKDGLTSFLKLSVLEAKIFQYGFLEEHNVCENTGIDRHRGEMKWPLWRLNQNFWPPRKTY